MTHNIVLCYPVEPHHLQLYRDSFPDSEIINAGQEGIARALFDADIYVGHAKVPVDWPSVVAAGRLQLIQSSAAGLDHCLVPSVIDSPIQVCSASGLFANQVAEQAMALLLGLIRGIPTFFRQTQNREFIRKPTDDLHGKKVGIVGFGGNGRRLAQVLAQFDCTLRATDYYPVSKPEYVEELLPAEKLLDLARWSEVLILCLPLNDRTRGIIDRQVLEAMPSGSYLINVARGQVLCETDFVAALESGHLAGGGLDVTETEPPPQDCPLWKLENLLVTPHVGAQSAHRVNDSTKFACDNLRRFLKGQPVLNVVNKQLGFPHPKDMAVLQRAENNTR